MGINGRDILLKIEITFMSKLICQVDFSVGVNSHKGTRNHIGKVDRLLHLEGIDGNGPPVVQAGAVRRGAPIPGVAPHCPSNGASPRHGASCTPKGISPIWGIARALPTRARVMAAKYFMMF